MKSRLINTVCAIGQRLPLRFSKSLPRLSQTGMALGGAVCVLTLSGCYYPYGYYPAGYYPYYATVPATAYPAGSARRARRFIRACNSNNCNNRRRRVSKARLRPMRSPPRLLMWRRPYPAYYPPPVYPAYYGYPGWYAPSVSIGFGFGGYWGGHGGWGGHGHWH